MTRESQTISETMKKIESLLNEKSGPIQDFNGVFQFTIKDKDLHIYTLIIKDGSATIYKGETSTDPDCTFQMSNASFTKFLSAKLNGRLAFMSGKLKINGDMSKAFKLESLFKQYQREIG